MPYRFTTMTMLALLCSVLLFNAPTLQATPAGLKIPDVPVTGGKKLKRSHDGNIAGVMPMPGLSKPTIISWEELTTKHYDLRRTLPKPRPQELTYTEGFIAKHKVTTIDLPRLMRTLTVKVFSDPKYHAEEYWVKSFGNIIAEFKRVKSNPRETDALLDKLEKQYPEIYAEVTPYLQQLVRDDFLYSSKWDPYKDESVKGKQNDGILFVDHWRIQADPSRLAVWNENLGEHKVYQGAAIIYADIQTIKEMERDYANYFVQVGQEYMEVYPVQGSYYRGVDANGNDFMFMQNFLRNDLPFPYESASYIMNILEYYDADGIYNTDYYSDNKEDLNWMAGRDVYFPILTMRNELVGNMIVTNLDFDIKNVPERDIDRIVGMKAGLGNMKRISEQMMDKKSATVKK